MLEEVGFSEDTYVSVDLLMSSGPAGKGPGWALQSNCRLLLHLEQVFQNVITKNIVFTQTVHASHWFIGLNVASTHKTGYVRNAKGLLIWGEGCASMPAFGSLLLVFKLSIYNYLFKKIWAAMAGLNIKRNIQVAFFTDFPVNFLSAGSLCQCALSVLN